MKTSMLEGIVCYLRTFLEIVLLSFSGWYHTNGLILCPSLSHIPSGEVWNKVKDTNVWTFYVTSWRSSISCCFQNEMIFKENEALKKTWTFCTILLFCSLSVFCYLVFPGCGGREIAIDNRFQWCPMVT